MPLKSAENLWFSDDFRGKEFHQFSQIRLTLEAKLGDDSIGKGFLILTRVGLSFEFEAFQEQFLPVFWGGSLAKKVQTL